MSLAVIPTTIAVDAAWDEYVALVGRRDKEPSLLTDRAFNEEIVRAWKRWFDAFLRVV